MSLASWDDLVAFLEGRQRADDRYQIPGISFTGSDKYVR